MVVVVLEEAVAQAQLVWLDLAQTHLLLVVQVVQESHHPLQVPQ